MKRPHARQARVKRFCPEIWNEPPTVVPDPPKDHCLMFVWSRPEFLSRELIVILRTIEIGSGVKADADE